MESCPHPKQKIYVDLGIELSDQDLLRRAEKFRQLVQLEGGAFQVLFSRCGKHNSGKYSAARLAHAGLFHDGRKDHNDG